jgi:hypothetical protein
MSYDPNIKVFYAYGVNDSEVIKPENRLTPAPKLDITNEYYYANDIIVGYSYIVTLKGYACSVDLSENKIGIKFNDVIDSLQKIKSILNTNGGRLLAVSKNNGVIIRCHGGIIRSINFSESDNNWFNYIPYTAEIEFDEIEFADCESVVPNMLCTHVPEGIKESTELIDMKKYRVKSFNDSWSFELSDQIYNGYDQFRNDHFSLSYSVDASGQHYFKDDKVLPAWEQAKNFVQDRVRKQITKLNNSVLRRNDDGCSPDSNLKNLFRSAPPGLLEGLPDANYGIYNETITCNTSESDGSFSANYQCLVKRKGDGGNFAEDKCLHTFSTSRDVQDDGIRKIVTISVDGNIQGLIEGGLIKSSHNLSFPQSGRLFLTHNPSTTRYDNALSAYNKIGGKSSLKDDFKSFLGITNAALIATGQCIDPNAPPPEADHSVAHNYTEGTISYKSSYNTERACASSGSFNSISVSIEDSTPIIAEFIVPGRIDGPIIQRIGPKTPRKITVNIQGAANPDCCFINEQEDILADICPNGLPLPSGVPPLPGSDASRKLVQDQMTSNPLDGSYTISKTYICCD